MNLKVTYALLKEACSAWAEDHASTPTSTVRGPKEVLCYFSTSELFIGPTWRESQCNARRGFEEKAGEQAKQKVRFLTGGQHRQALPPGEGPWVTTAGKRFAK